MKRLLACLLVTSSVASAFGAAKVDRHCDGLDEILSVQNENVTVTGLWMIASEEITNNVSRPLLEVSGGDLTFCEGAAFQTDDLTVLGPTSLLWKVSGGTVTGMLKLDPPNPEWDIVTLDDGRTGLLVRNPERMTFLQSVARWFGDLADQFHRCFVANQRWRYLTDGLRITLKVALFSVLLGAFIGFLVAIVRATHDKSGHFPVLNAVLKVYLTVIRGTPMAVQLLIAYFIIFASCNNKTLVAILAFGLNSGAYVAEIMRAGIVSIDAGQMEAGRSLGLSYSRTMLRVILPQAVRNVLPALGNEFIVLLKDTSIASFIALQDLAKGGEIIRSQTYNVYLPFLMVAAVYLVLVMFFTWALGRFERHLRNTGADVVHGNS